MLIERWQRDLTELRLINFPKRMFWPVTISIGTTLSIFIPMFFMPGVSGQFLADDRHIIHCFIWIDIVCIGVHTSNWI